MPVYSLDERLIFPDTRNAEPTGLLCIGGDLSVRRLLLAYSSGIFPWFSKEDPPLWWSPDPRFILKPDEFSPSKSLRQVIRNTKYKLTFDENFREVIENCAGVRRKDQAGTWITDSMKSAYIDLHKAGFAHSVEIKRNNKITGGLYGVSLGKAFFGESMFHIESNASKIAFYHLVERLNNWHFHFIDAQVETPHLKSLGAKAIPREDFLVMLNKALKFPTKKGMW